MKKFSTAILTLASLGFFLAGPAYAKTHKTTISIDLAAPSASSTSSNDAAPASSTDTASEPATSSTDTPAATPSATSAPVHEPSPVTPTPSAPAQSAPQKKSADVPAADSATTTSATSSVVAAVGPAAPSLPALLTPSNVYASPHLPLIETEGLLSLAIAIGIVGFLLAEQKTLRTIYENVGGIFGARPRERESRSRA